jgi:tetratricopeptide (TPR) repeat protein
LVLRLQSLQFDISRNQEVKDSLQAALLKEDNLPYASPGVLAQMGRLSVASDRQELTNTIYEYFLGNFEESDLILEALKGLGEIRISQGKFTEAEALLTDVITRFPQLPHSADAYLRLGDIYRMQERWDEAVEIYNLILSVKEWRGELWPIALNRIGDTYREMGEDLKASGFYERVYILYQSYPPQAAEAYTKRADTLIQLGEASKAKEVLLEMLDNPDLASQAIAQEARITLLQLP